MSANPSASPALRPAGLLPPEIILRCWETPAFLEELRRSPQSLLREAGIDLPDTTEIRIVEDLPQTLHFILPACPEGLHHMEPAAFTPDKW